MEEKQKRYYLVAEEYLPRAIRQTARVKEALSESGEAGLGAALEEAGISKSTYYKYKDGVFSFYRLGAQEIVNLSLQLVHETGVLSGVLNLVAECGGTVLTINQGLPALNGATVTLSVGMGEARVSAQTLLERLGALHGVSEAKFCGASSSVQ